MPQQHDLMLQTVNARNFKVIGFLDLQFLLDFMNKDTKKDYTIEVYYEV